MAEIYKNILTQRQHIAIFHVYASVPKGRGVLSRLLLTDQNAALFWQITYGMLAYKETNKVWENKHHYTQDIEH